MIIIPDDQPVELVQKFVDAFHATQEHVDNSDHEAAAEGYKQMLAAYNDIAAAKLDPLHKELAYDQLVKVYKSLQDPPQHSIHATTHIIAAAVLLVLFSFLVFFRPTIFGFTTAEPVVIQDVNWAFVDSGSRAVHLDAMPRSLSITGRVDGPGMVRAYAITQGSRVLVFDNDLARVNPDGTFDMACVNTCSSGLDSKDFALDVVVQNAALTIYSIEYRS